jgi:hypothetical protein
VVGGQQPAVVFGPSPATLRDPFRRTRWSGLSAGDAAVLELFLSRLGRVPDELHTAVPVGGAPDFGAAPQSDGIRRFVQSAYPRKIDAALRWGETWWLVEAKGVTHAASAGQLLAYYYWWVRDVPQFPVSRLVLLCAECDPDVREFVSAVGIDLVELEVPDAPSA